MVKNIELTLIYCKYTLEANATFTRGTKSISHVDLLHQISRTVKNLII